MTASPTTPPETPGQPPAGGKIRPPRMALDQHATSLSKRFLAEWVVPRWREVLASFVLMALLAAATGAYPAIIKLSFDTLLNKTNSGALIWVLGAIVGITLLRSIVLYLQTVATNRLVLRITTDMQQQSLPASGACRFRPPGARDSGPADVAADQRHRVHPTSPRWPR